MRGARCRAPLTVAVCRPARDHGDRDMSIPAIVMARGGPALREGAARNYGYRIGAGTDDRPGRAGDAPRVGGDVDLAPDSTHVP
jgi:hypothetical protein